MPGRARRAVLGSVPPHLRARACEILTIPRLFNEARSGPQQFEREHAGWTVVSRLRAWMRLSYIVTDYGLSWFEDQVFMAQYRRLCPGNDRSANRKYFLRSLLKLADRLPGDTAECGVYEGASSWFICDHFRNSGKVHHAFDSFEGLSKPAVADGRYWRAGNLNTSEERARATLADFDVRYYKGWIPERFSEVKTREFSFVHIDVDLYEPTKSSLEFFYPRMVQGGIIVCDDYGFITCPGALRAMQDFMTDRPEPIVACPTGQAFVIKGP